MDSSNRDVLKELVAPSTLICFNAGIDRSTTKNHVSGVIAFSYLAGVAASF